MNLRTSDRPGLAEKLAARRAVRRQRRQLEEILASNDSPALRQEINALYTRQNAQLRPSVERRVPQRADRRRAVFGLQTEI